MVWNSWLLDITASQMFDLTPAPDSDSWLLTPDSRLLTPDSWLLTPTPDSDSWLRLLTPRDSNVNNSRNHQDKEQAWRLTPTPTLAPVSNSNFWLWLLTPTPDQWYVNLIFCLCLHTWPYVKESIFFKDRLEDFFRRRKKSSSLSLKKISGGEIPEAPKPSTV